MSKFIIFWLSQCVSRLGSAMTAFALNLWTYEQTGSAMSVSLLSFFYFVSYVAAGIFAGTFVDRHNKKLTALISDSFCALGTLSILAAAVFGGLRVWHICAVNALTGFMNAFQQPVSAVLVRQLVPKDKIDKAAGLNALSEHIVNVLCPVLAATLYAVNGTGLVIAADIATFLFAVAVLVFFVKVPEQKTTVSDKKPFFSEMYGGMLFLKKEKGLFKLMLMMSVIMFTTMLTYQNTLSPMILARSKSSAVLGAVNAFIGVGGIFGGIIASVRSKSVSNVKLICLCSAFSFIFGDFLMGIGRNAVMWCIAGVASSLPVPFITAGQNVLMYEHIPKEIQGRVFSFRNAIQNCLIPVGILCGGFLADNVFEPFMKTENAVSDALKMLVGSGDGSGMAVMFLLTSVIGFTVSIMSLKSRDIRKLNNK